MTDKERITKYIESRIEVLSRVRGHYLDDMWNDKNPNKAEADYAIKELRMVLNFIKAA